MDACYDRYNSDITFRMHKLGANLVALAVIFSGLTSSERKKIHIIHENLMQFQRQCLISNV